MKKILLLNLLFLNFFTTINAEEAYEEYENDENDEYEEISEDLLAYIQENDIEEGEELVREARCASGDLIESLCTAGGAYYGGPVGAGLAGFGAGIAHEAYHDKYGDRDPLLDYIYNNYYD